MNIIASSHHPLRRHTVKLAVPDNAPAPRASDTSQLLKAVRAVSLNTVAPGIIAKSGWELTTVPNSMSPQQLSTFLAERNLPAAHAPGVAEELHHLLSHPAVRGVLFGVSGGAVVYGIVEKTDWPRRKVWTVTLASGLAISALYFVLRHFGYIV